MRDINVVLEQFYLDDLLNKNYEFRKSPIHGVGAFSKTKFNKGDFINTHILPHKNDKQVTAFGRNLNHSETPNAISKKENDGCYKVYALTDINPGDEITLDYRVNQDLEQPQKNWNVEGVKVDPKTFSKQNKKKTVFLKVDGSDESNMPAHNPFIGEEENLIDEEDQGSGIINTGNSTVFGKTNPRTDQETYLALLKNSGPKFKVKIKKKDAGQ
jgi:hypothetical protein